MTTLEASAVFVERGGRNILENASARATSGDFLAVIGPNGAGKSTLLSVLAGLLKPDRGSVTLDGTVVGGFSRSALAQRRAYLPQNPRCEWPISVERLVMLGLTPRLPPFGDIPASDAARVRDALIACDLLERKDQTATSLSGGELARAMLARAFVADPDVLIVDEPLAGLDPRHLLDAAHRLRAFARAGKIVVASIHDLTVVGRYATHVLALRDGRIEASGDTRSVLTSSLMRSVFEVDATVGETPLGAFVDFAEGVATSEAPG